MNIGGALEIQDNGKYLFEEIIDRYCNDNLPVNWKVEYFPAIKLLDVVRRSFNYTEDKYKEGLRLTSTKKIFFNVLLRMK